MAETTSPVVPIMSAASEVKVREYLCMLLDRSRSNSEYIDKLDVIDKAYARYLDAKESKDLVGAQQFGSIPCNASDRAIVSPIVISQVQSMTAYLCEVYLSGYPIFPVTSGPAMRGQAEALEGIIQDHLVMSESIPELQILLHEAAKYNTAAWELVWSPITSYQPQKELTDLEPGSGSLRTDYKHINRIKRIDQRNFHYDRLVPFAKVSTDGEYAGYTEVISRVNLKAHLNYLSTERRLLNRGVVKKALQSNFVATDYREPPKISPTINGDKTFSWDQYGGWEPTDTKVPSNDSGKYLIHKFFLRLIPSDFDIAVANKNTVQIFKVEMVNRDTIIRFEPYFGAYGAFGIGCCSALEDGMDMQTQGYGEMAIPLQEMVTRLYNIRLQGAKRALQDRALYNSRFIRPADINSPLAAPKIPVTMDGMLEGSLDAAYKAIPFDSRGTENVLSDAREITEWQRELSGMNNATRGQFQKGNKTMHEFDTVMGNSENRMRLPAQVLEFRMMQRIKNQMKLNILQFGEDTEIISPRTGQPLEVSIEELQAVNLQFEVADGYTPKGKMANTEMLTQGMLMVSQSPQLQAAYGSQLPAMFAHMMTLSGVRGFDQYTQTAVEEWQASFSLQAQIAQLQMQLQQALGQAGGQPPSEEQQQ